VKKTYILIVALVWTALGGCKKHDVEIQSRPEYIVGEWRLERVTIYGIEYDLTDCHRQSYMLFDSNGRAESKYYTIYNNGDCVLHLHYRGRWEYHDDKFYFYIEEYNTSQPPEDMEKELHFQDPDHFYVEEEFEGYEGKLYFEKI